MVIKFYGTRGSVPVCNPEYQKFGGNTTGIKITAKDTNNFAVFDAGTGIRDLGNDLLASGYRQEEILIVYSHFHWDHIQGFPFFKPCFNPEQKISIVALGKGRNIKSLKGIFEIQMQSEFFPVQLDSMGAKFEFHLTDEDTDVIKDVKDSIVTANRHNHPDGAYGYRIERNNKVLVICTDIEHGDRIDLNVVKLSQDADLLIHEGQYTNEELKKKKGWGHSSFEQAIQVAEMAGVKKLAITHHDPGHDDEFLSKIEKECQEKFPNCVLARENMEIEM